MPESIITIANQRVDIERAAALLDIDMPLASAKTYCPFGEIYHADGGQSRALKVYPETNSAYCFAGCGYLNPVKLVALDKGWSEHEAAEFLLEATGYVAPTPEARWAALVVEDKPSIDQDALAAAFQLRCARLFPDWDERQFDAKVSKKLAQALSLLPKVTTEEEQEKWLTVATQAMQKVMSS